MAQAESSAAERLTRRQLPWGDLARIEILPPAHREMASRTWLGRASGELHTAGTFTFLSLSLARIDAPARFRQIARDAIHEEQRHAEICRRMASIYAGHEVAMPPLYPIPLPTYRGAPEPLRASLHVIGQCCVNETTAGAFLERCLDGTTEPLARKVLLELLGDEIEHARLGWAHLAHVCETARGRADLSHWLPIMLRLNLARWRAEFVILPGDALWMHGCPPSHEIDAAVLDGMRTLIIPGFERAGVDVTEARAWCETLTQRPARDHLVPAPSSTPETT